MSYINNSSQQFILAKLTQKGRELLSKGKLTFSKWAIGDSEINYSVTGQTQTFLTPKDNQPDIKYYIPNASGNLMILLDNELQTSKIKLINRRSVDTSTSATTIDWSENINWDSELLQFNPSCSFDENVITWNKQNIYKQSLIGTTGNTNQCLDYIKSAKYLGQFNVLDDDSVQFSDTNGLNPCLDYSESMIDNNTSMSVIFFPQDKAFNYYGEELYIDDDNLFNIYLPELQYHRTIGTLGMTSGTTSGTTFISDTTLKYLGTNETPYYNLLEDISTTIDDKARVVGRVFPGLQLCVFTDDEIVAALEEKSGRTYTLPELQINLLPTNKTNEIVLQENEVLYLTYVINDGIFPCQNIVKTINMGKSGKYVKIDFVSEIPQWVDSVNTIYLLWQKVTSNDILPTVDGWNKLNILPYYSNNTLKDLYLKANDFVVDNFKLIDFNIDLYDNIIGNTKDLNSVIETSYCVDVYKSVFKFHISQTEFGITTNPTYQIAVDNGVETNVKISEIGIYSENDELVMIGKIGYPIDIISNSMITIHMGIDF